MAALREKKRIEIQEANEARMEKPPPQIQR